MAAPVISLGDGFLDGGIVKGTCLYIFLGLAMSTGSTIYFGRPENGHLRKEYVCLAIATSWIAAVCMWLMWLFTYMHQMNPLFAPIRAKEG